MSIQSAIQSCGKYGHFFYFCIRKQSTFLIFIFLTGNFLKYFQLRSFLCLLLQRDIAFLINNWFYGKSEKIYFR